MYRDLRLAIFISGGGSTMEAIMQAIRTRQLPHVRVALVVASRHDAGGIAKAANFEMPAEDVVIRAPSDYASTDDFGRALLLDCMERGVEFVGQYGWMPQTPCNVIRAYEGRMINQHPGPVPAFGGKGMYGRRVHAAVIHYLCETARRLKLKPGTPAYADHFRTEMTSQLVAPEYDAGPIVQTMPVTVDPTDTAVTLAERALPVEHQLQIAVLRWASEGLPMGPYKEPWVIPPRFHKVLQWAKERAIAQYPHG